VSPHGVNDQLGACVGAATAATAVASAPVTGVVGIVPAAGRGERLGGAIPKALRVVDGRTLLDRALDALLAVCEHVVVAVPAGVALDLPSAVSVVPGGATRSDSVRAALAAALLIVPDAEYVLVHDAARPDTPVAVSERVLGALRAGAQAVIPVLPVVDTIKSVDADGRVVATPDRAALRIVQTPQGFTTAVLVAAHRGEADATDDAGLVEALGIAVHTVPGDPAAAKVTTTPDIAALEARLAARAAPSPA
jgi:2-C-methyl-D-erythritol 4-phosphate cytidylyltransferase